MNFDYKENGEKEKLFLQIHSINTVYPNIQNMIVVPIKKRMEIIPSIQVCLISQMNFDIRKVMQKKAFLGNPKHQYRVSQCREHDCSANNKKDREYYKYLSLSYFTDEP